MQEKLNQFAINQVWVLVHAPYGKTIIGSKWVFKNKKDETGIVMKNKARLVAQGYNQQEGMDYDETFALMEILEAIRIFLSFVTYMNFTVYQIDVKSAFLNEKLKEEIYVKRPLGFESSEFPNHFCKLGKALYGLKQAPRAWYETLSTFLTEHKFVRGKIDNKLFLYKTQTDVILVQIYVDDIIFVSTSTKLCKQFAKLMTQRYEMSMIGVLTYFLRFQIKQSKRGILINQEKYVNDLQKKYDIDGSSVKTLMVPPNNLGPNLNGESVKELGQSNGIRALDRTCVMECKKRQQFVAMSLAKAEYVVAAVLHSRTKHIDIKYHFIRDHILKGDIELHFIPTQYQYADIFTKPLDEPTFKRLICELEQSYSSHTWICMSMCGFIAFAGAVRSLWNLKAPNTSSQAKKKGSRGKKPRAKSRLRRKQSSKHIFESKTEAHKFKTSHSDQETMSSLTLGSNPSQPLASTPIVVELHKEDQQAGGGPTSLRVTGEEGGDPQLSSGMPAFIHNKHVYLASFIIHSESTLGCDASADSTAKVDPGISDPNDPIPQQ
ncbi:retrovirus-related pol polyprotein from transposon TNT 1-94 [Tanacetum coccineum]